MGKPIPPVVVWGGTFGDDYSKVDVRIVVRATDVVCERRDRDSMGEHHWVQVHRGNDVFGGLSEVSVLKAAVREMTADLHDNKHA